MRDRQKRILLATSAVVVIVIGAALGGVAVSGSEGDASAPATAASAEPELDSEGSTTAEEIALKPVTGLGSGESLGLDAGAAEQARSQHRYANAYRNWTYPVRARTIVQQVEPKRMNRATFFAETFTFNSGTGAYIGIQQTSSNTATRKARFSIWDSTKAYAGPGASCRAFGGEGVGRTCEVAYWFQTGRAYRYRVERTKKDDNGAWYWKGSIIDTVTGQTTVIGLIRSPRRATAVVGGATFSEYYGDAVPCNRVPPSEQAVLPPQLNSGERATGASSSTGSCSGGRVTSAFGATILQLGV